MHLLSTRPGEVSDGTAAVDLGQTPGDLLVLSAADTELAALASAFDRWTVDPADARPSLRLANLLALQHNYSVDLYVERMVGAARLVVVRILGGVRYWPYGAEQIAAAGRHHGIGVAFLPGDDRPDPELERLSTLPAAAVTRLWRYLIHGGPGNLVEFLRYAATLAGWAGPWREPAPLPRAALHWPGQPSPHLDDLRSRWRPEWPVAGLVFYRALLQAGQTAPVDALIDALAAKIRASEAVTLLCSSACTDPERCHRTLLAEMLRVAVRE